MTFSSKYMMQLTLKTIVIMMHHLFYFYVWRLEMKERNTNRTRSKLKGFAAKIILWEKKGKYQSLDKHQKSNKIKESRILRTRQMIGRDIFWGEAPSRAITEKLAKVVRGVDAVVQSRPLFLIIILPARYGQPPQPGEADIAFPQASFILCFLLSLPMQGNVCHLPLRTWLSFWHDYRNRKPPWEYLMESDYQMIVSVVDCFLVWKI